MIMNDDRGLAIWAGLMLKTGLSMGLTEEQILRLGKPGVLRKALKILRAESVPHSIQTPTGKKPK